MAFEKENKNMRLCVACNKPMGPNHHCKEVDLNRREGALKAAQTRRETGVQQRYYDTRLRDGFELLKDDEICPD